MGGTFSTISFASNYVAHKGLVKQSSHNEGLRFAAHPRYDVTPSGGYGNSPNKYCSNESIV